jgi:hypothetical protein
VKFEKGDVILDINGLTVQGNWLDSVKTANNVQISGFCIETAKITSSSACCGSASSTNEICLQLNDRKTCLHPNLIEISKNCPCGDREVCALPYEKLFRIKTSSHDQIHFYGSASALYQAIDTTNKNIVGTIDLTVGLQKFLNYLMGISLALAMLNIIPVFYLDGEQILNLVENEANKMWLQRTKYVFGTILILNLVLGFIMNML